MQLHRLLNATPIGNQIGNIVNNFINNIIGITFDEILPSNNYAFQNGDNYVFQNGDNYLFNINT